MTTVLLTGASGRMASALRPALLEDFNNVRLFARSSIDNVAQMEEAIAGTLEDYSTVEVAVAGADVVIHLGGKADESDFAQIMSSNVVGTYNVFEAARRTGVRRVVYASSHHVTGFHRAEEMVSARSEVRPDTYYGVSKVCGEALGRLYHDKWGLEVVCLRIGVCRPHPETADQLRTWLSVPDSIRLVRAAAMNDLPDGFAIAYGVSANSQRFWDLGDAEAIGFSPEDSADDYAGTFEPDKPFSSHWQGGAFTAADYRGGIW